MARAADPRKNIEVDAAPCGSGGGKKPRDTPLEVPLTLHPTPRRRTAPIAGAAAFAGVASIAGLSLMALGLAGLAGCAKARIGMPKEGNPPGISAHMAQAPVVHRSTVHGRIAGGLPHSDFLARAGGSPEHRPGSAPMGGDTPLEQLLAEGDRPLPKNGLCPADMASIDDLYCVDRFEASLLEIMADGSEQPFPSTSTVEGHVVRAISERGALPQAYISGKQAEEACSRSGKRLCKATEWRKACRGPESKKYGYGDADEPKRCNDHGRAPLAIVHGLRGDSDARGQYNWARMNDPALNQVPGTVAKTGEHEGCTNGYGVHDMVGNVHEWIDDREGTFLGGYYLDTHVNGDGCSYTSDAHAFWYHDYSTGFRCCADVAP